VDARDDYRWLEDGKSAEVRAWSDAQNQRARAFLASLPGVAAIHARVAGLMKSRSPMWYSLRWRGGQLFAMKRQPPKQQPFLVVRTAATGGSERVLLDPMALDPSGHTAIDWYVPSLDGKRVAVSLSKNGSERGDLHVYDVATGKPLGDVVEHVQNGTAGGSAVFTADGTGLYYTRYPRAGERPAGEAELWQQVWFHKLGTPASADVYSLGKELPRIAEIVLDQTDDGATLLADVANGDGGEHEYFVHGSDGKWTQVSKFADKLVQAELGAGADRSLYLVSIAGAPRGKILKLPLAAPSLAKAKLIVPEGDGAIQGLTATPSRLWVSQLDGGPSRLVSYALDGTGARVEPTPPVSGSGSGVRLDGDHVLVMVRQYVAPAAWFHYSTAGKPEKTSLAETSTADFSDIEVTREWALSKDGTRVPYTLMRKRSVAKNGNNPALLTGYGGFGISVSPGFDPTALVWLEQGAVLAIANLRGGGEFGDGWHKAGMLTQKQHVFDDFIAVAEKLEHDKWTQPKKLAIEGGSNGGLLMGAVTTQRPELFAAVVSHVGLYDMLRLELSPNGVFNVTEYGSVKNAEQRKALFAYSPYHHVADGAAYPAMLFTTGANDPRVDPMHSRKMVARLQAASSSKSPILLRTNANAGHGLDSSLDDRISEATDVYAFLFSMLGITYGPVPPRG
ncbi:MAG TPA: prolyl oligopeptidase family serine peptidase, partial [Polyangia bacterium]